MSTIVVLKNISNSGKTETLRELAICLESKGAKLTFCEGDLEKGDFIVCIELDSRTITIVSHGDNPSLKKKLKEVFEECKKIDILFAASRTKGITRKIIKEVAKDKGMDIIWTSTYKNKARYATLNKVRAQELCELVDKI